MNNPIPVLIHLEKWVGAGYRTHDLWVSNKMHWPIDQWGRHEM